MKVLGIGSCLAWLGLTGQEALALRVAIIVVMLSVGMCVYMIVKLNDVARSATSANQKADSLIKRTEKLESRIHDEE